VTFRRTATGLGLTYGSLDCWRAVREDQAGRQAARLLREPPPPGLADQVRFAVELAAAGTIAPPRPRHGMRPRWRRLAGTGALAAAVAVTVAVLLPGGRETGTMPAAVAVVARYAQELPPVRPPRPGPAGPGAPAEVGHPVTMAAGGQQMVLWGGGWATWRRWSPSPPSPSPCPPAPTAPPARAWRGPRGWAASGCTAATATPQNW
jgi:hypothetical protein